MNIQSVHAAGPPAPSAFENPITTGFVILALILLLIIAILANLLIGVAQVKIEKEKKTAASATAVAVAALLLLFCSPVHAQATDAAAATAISNTAGISAMALYLMATVIFVELMVILVLLVNVKILLKAEKAKLADAAAPATAPITQKLNALWMRLNSFRPAEQEAAIDLGHDYDGIRELDNRLPPWWLYGFYLTILVAGIYLYRYHVSHTGLSSGEEYAAAVANADIEVKEYLKKKGDAVDENTVKLLKAPEEIAAGKEIFLTSCIACHKEDARGDVGPNLTDDYWLHGGDVKSIFKTIRYGINAMPQWQNSYSNKQIAQLTSFVKSLKGTNPANAKAPQGVLYKEEDGTSAKPATDSTAAKDSSAISRH